MKELNIEKELIIMAPTQIKSDLSIGNIFDLTLIDFYIKARKFFGVEVFFPFLWNINGDPLVKQLLKEKIEFNKKNIDEYVFRMIKKAEIKMKEYFIDFDISLRDDQILKEINKLFKTRYSDMFNFGLAKISQCSKCEMIFGSDPSIKICKFCASSVEYIEKKTLFKEIRKEEIIEKINSIVFYPESIRKKILDFVNKMPYKYDLILEKDRKYTLEYKNTKLDPRFIAFLFPAILNNNTYDKVTWIHGDVVKKFDYYALCYLNKGDCPNRIVSHGLILGADKKKARWQKNDNSELEVIANIDNKFLRAYFLKHNINTNISIDSGDMDTRIKGIIRLYITINKLLESRNVGELENGTRNILKNELDKFHKNIERFMFGEAFKNMQNYVDLGWKLTKDNKLSKDEQSILLKFRNIYFGE